MLPSTTPHTVQEPQAIRLTQTSIHIVRWLGDGGGGTVYLAKLKGAHDFERVIVMKQANEGHPEYAECLKREAVILGMLAGHPNIIGIISCADRMLESGSVVPVILMEFGGSSLASVLRVGRPDVGLALHIILKVLDALVYAHSKGVVHRDVKPGNVLITPEGGVKVSDFGIAKSDELQQKTTERAAGKGTLAYIAPEVIRGAKPDARSDVWAVCVMLYEMLAGRLPWEPKDGTAADWKGDLSSRIVSEDPPPLDPKVATEKFAAIVMRGLSKKPDDRFATAAELRSVLHELDYMRLAEHVAVSELELLRQASESPLTRKGHGHGTPRSATRTVPRQAELREPVKMVAYTLPDGPKESFFTDSNDMPLEARTSDLVERSDTLYRSDTKYRSDTQERSDVIHHGSHWQLVERGDRARDSDPHSSQKPASRERLHTTDILGEAALPPPKPGSRVQRARMRRYLLIAGAAAATLVVTTVVALKLTTASTPASNTHERAAADAKASEEVPAIAAAPVVARPSHPAATSAAAPSADAPREVAAERDATGVPAPDSKSDAPARTSEAQAKASARASLRVDVGPNGGYAALDGRKPVLAPATFANLRVGHHVLRVGRDSATLNREERVRLTEGANTIRIELPPPPSPGKSPFDVE